MPIQNTQSDSGKPGQLSAQSQFGRQAHLYVESVVHREGESLDVVREWASRGRYNRATDVGTGTGFTAFAVAAYAEDTLATDITLAMLREARQIAVQKGHSNLRFALAAAESLPFGDGTLDLVTCRTAAHHFQDIPAAVAEWRRVLSPGGVLILADTTCPEEQEVARWMNDIELRRDQSHQRDLPPSEWLALLVENGIDPTDSTLAPVNLEFDDWVKRSGTHTDEVERLRRDFLHAPPEAVAAFDIRQENDGAIHFHWDCLVVRGVPSS